MPLDRGSVGLGAPGRESAPERRLSRNATGLVVVGLASLANGVALVLHIVGGLPLGALLAVVWLVAAVSIGAICALGGPSVRAGIVRTVAVGLVVGLLATLLYDVTKAVLAQFDPTPYNPFEATRIFGRLLIGADASPTAITIVGWTFHIMNGTTFAIAFACLFARGGQISRVRGLATGIGWGVFLETFQLALYPGWLSIGFVDEFRRISFLSHVVFGATIGLLVPAGLREANRRAAVRGRT